MPPSAESDACHDGRGRDQPPRHETARPAGPATTRRSTAGPALLRCRAARRRCPTDGAGGPSRDIARSRRRIERAVSPRGSAVRSGSWPTMPASRSVTLSPANAGRPVSISYKHAAERPDVRALVDRLAARLLGAHVGGRAEHDAGARVPATRDGRRLASGAGAVTSRAERFGEAEVQHLHGAVRASP